MTTETGRMLCFDYNLQGILFFLILLHVIYLIVVKKRLIKKKFSGELMFMLVDTTLLMVMNCLIAHFGFSLSMYTGIAQAIGWLAWVGKYTWLTFTPMMYVFVVLLCWKIKIMQPEGNADMVL